jgi:alginate O-acetyltransferase complex protein AlgI
MVVNSFSFLLFFAFLFALYYFAFNERTKLQNWLLLIASYVFYAFASIKAIPILAVSTIVTYYLGLRIAKYNGSNPKAASMLTTIGVCLGIGLLLYFKYLNFFISSFASFFNSVGLQCNAHSFNILLPIGISFFTFKLMSYLIEVHRRKMDATTDFVAFATFVAFFPTILSGPIDRPDKFIPQLKEKRTFDYNLAKAGFNQIVWGMFLKMCIADKLAVYNDSVMNSYSFFGGSSVLFALLLYPLQMYADFAGYSDMAIGVGKLLGFKIALNFDYPFFARNIAEYWRKWHISLTSWLTDYVFIPLNIHFRNWGNWGVAISIVVTMTLIGFWHGANWTFGLFGLYHGLLFLPLVFGGMMLKRRKLKLNSWNLPEVRYLPAMLLTYVFVAIGLVLFRSDTLAEAFCIFESLFGGQFGFSWCGNVIPILLLILLFHDLHKAFNFCPRISKLPFPIISSFLLLLILFLSNTSTGDFIYFHF